MNPRTIAENATAATAGKLGCVLAIPPYNYPVNLAMWFAPLVYLFVTEPPLYFPEWFGLDEQYGFIFAHNVFTVQFMWDRLPLYIVAIYPALSQLVYEVVRVMGVFKHRGALAADDAAWERFFATSGLPVLEIGYGGLVRDLEGTLDRALDHVGVVVAHPSPHRGSREEAQRAPLAQVAHGHAHAGRELLHTHRLDPIGDGHDISFVVGSG